MHTVLSGATHSSLLSVVASWRPANFHVSHLGGKKSVTSKVTNGSLVLFSHKVLYYDIFLSLTPIQARDLVSKAQSSANDGGGKRMLACLLSLIRQRNASMAWSERQQAVIAIVPKFSASLSIIGSSCIIVECLFVDRRKLERVYHRILLAMSIIDVIESSWNFCSTWPIPRGTRGVAFAAGNVTTCTAQGFILEFGLAIPMLNMCLSIYYLLVIKYSWSEDKIRKRAEPWFHGVSLCVALAFALAGIPMKLYSMW